MNKNNLMEARKKVRMSQQGIASLLNTTAQLYGTYENGIRKMSLEKYIILSKYYNVSLEYLCGLTGNETVTFNTCFEKATAIQEAKENVETSLERMKYLRLKNKLSQSDLSKILSTVKTQYEKYETGKQRMSIDKYILLAQYYNVSLEYLCGISEEITPLHSYSEDKKDESLSFDKISPSNAIEERSNTNTPPDDNLRELERIWAKLDIKGKTLLLAYAYEQEENASLPKTKSNNKGA